MKFITQLHSYMLTRELNEDGQSTAEYSLVIVGAAAVAGLLIAWASGGDSISKLFEKVIRAVTGRIE